MSDDVIAARLAEIPLLSYGSHKSFSDGACVMEAVAYVAGECHSDHPKCVSAIIAGFLRVWNDRLPDAERDALLRPLIPRVIGTISTHVVEMRRSFMALDWLVRECLPAWLRLACLREQADTLLSHEVICNAAQVGAVIPHIAAAQKAAASTSRHCHMRHAIHWRHPAAAARAAAAAEAAAEAGAAAAAAAEWDVAGELDVAGAAAAAGAIAAEWDVAGAAARDAAGGALASTKLYLQQSALALIDRMIAVGDTP